MNISFLQRNQTVQLTMHNFLWKLCFTKPLLLCLLSVFIVNGELMFSEIMYKPDSSGAEFLEFKNNGASPIEVSGYTIVSAITFVFPPNTILPPSSFYVIAANVSEFETAYAMPPNQTYSGKLSSRGESILLYSSAAQLIANVTYLPVAPWPIGADGNGFSLTTKDPNANSAPGDVNSWKLSTRIGGSPFADDFVPNGVIDDNLRNLRITEIMYNPADYNGINGTEFEFIEIKNVGNVNVDLSSLRIVDAVDFTFEAGALLEPQSFFVIAANSTQFQLKYGRAPSGVFSGKLNNAGERILFVDSNWNTILSVTYSDKGQWPGSASSGISISLVPENATATGDPNDPLYWRGSTLIDGTPFADDIGPTVPVNEALFNLTITEIMYKPALYSFIELKNIGDVALNLSGAALVNGIYIVFPSSLILDSKQFLVLAANASQFQLKYQKSPSLQYNGQLKELVGEAIKLNDANGNTIWKVKYLTTSPWPTVADGYSLVPITSSATADLNDPSNWKVSSRQWGSPFLDDSLSPSSTTQQLTSNPVIRTGEGSAASVFEYNLFLILVILVSICVSIY